MGGHRKYCSARCYKLSRSKHYREGNPAPELTAGTMGAISECLVIVDLLSKKFDVFRAISPSAKCDLVAFKNGNILRVEVTTGHYTSESKNVTYPKHNPDNYDIVAVVVHDKIYYFPDLST